MYVCVHHCCEEKGRNRGKRPDPERARTRRRPYCGLRVDVGHADDIRVCIDYRARGSRSNNCVRLTLMRRGREGEIKEKPYPIHGGSFDETRSDVFFPPNSCSFFLSTRRTHNSYTRYTIF